MEKAEFRNTSRGVCGVVVTEAGEKPRGIAVGPGETVWLTEEDQILTANAPRRAEDNPFINGTLTLETAPQDIANRRPIGHSDSPQPELSEKEKKRLEDKKQKEAEASEKYAEQQKREEEAKAEKEKASGEADDEETGLQAEPVGDPPEGERAQSEEVGTPKAAKPKPKPAKTG